MHLLVLSRFAFVRRAFVALALSVLAFATSARADLVDQVKAHLAAGEFAPAAQIAQRAANRDESDRVFAAIATAQAAAGLRDAALRSVDQISDDRVRTAALASMGDNTVRARGGLGGGTEVDFQPIMDLIQKTVAPTTWDINGGQGAIDGFAGGVFVDPVGVMRPLVADDKSGNLQGARTQAQHPGENSTARSKSVLRKVSLARLEKEVQLRLAAGRDMDDDMRTLAGLQRIKYVFVYPPTEQQSGDIVIAGPAGDWRVNDEDRLVSTDNGNPVLQLDDLVVILRHMNSGADARFGCNIKPTAAGLASMKSFVETSNKTPLKPGAAARNAWLQQVASKLGKQDIEVYGVDPRTRVGRVMVEADYRMKLVGMGLEGGVDGVPSYLELVKAEGDAAPPLEVLRWWFTLNYDAVKATPDRNAFALEGQGVKVLSENELLTALGKRVHTGQAEQLNRRFAENFTAKFDLLAAKYPVYAELRNLFDLALVGALMRTENLGERADWHMSYFGDKDGYQVALAPAAKQVDTVINHTLVGKTRIIAGVSGGVTVDPNSLVRDKSLKIEQGGVLDSQRNSGQPQQLQHRQWWWD